MFDGDLVLVFDDDRVLAGVDRDAIPAIDVDDKIATTPEEYTTATRLKVILRTMKNLIGEYSNYGTAYRNKCPRTEEQRQKYMTYIDVISVLVGKSIDYAKTGVLYPMPRSISRYGRPLPYFMKYASPYYAKQKLARTYSNLNRMCWDLENWEKRLRWSNKHKRFDWHLMIDDEITPPEQLVERLDAVYARFCKDVREISNTYKGVGADNELMKSEYGRCYEVYRSECKLLCPNQKMLANVLVRLCYERHPSWNRKFMWLMAGPGIVANIKQADYDMPVRDDNGPYEYMGRNYSMVKIEDARKTRSEEEY